MHKRIKEQDKEIRSPKEENEFLDEASVFAANRQKSAKPYFLALKIEDSRIIGKIAFYCRILIINRQGFYTYLAKKDRPRKYQNLANLWNKLPAGMNIMILMDGSSIVTKTVGEGNCSQLTNCIPGHGPNRPEPSAKEDTKWNYKIRPESHEIGWSSETKVLRRWTLPWFHTLWMHADQNGDWSSLWHYDTKQIEVEELKVLIWRYRLGYWSNRRACPANSGLPPMSKQKQYYETLNLAA